MYQSLIYNVKFAGILVHFLLAEVCHCEISETDSGIAWIANHKPRLGAENYHESSYVKLAIHIECWFFEVPLNNHFIE